MAASPPVSRILLNKISSPLVGDPFCALTWENSPINSSRRFCRYLPDSTLLVEYSLNAKTKTAHYAGRAERSTDGDEQTVTRPSPSTS